MSDPNRKESSYSEKPNSSDLISRLAAIDALEKVADMFPWRVPGNRDTYDRYNEAWNDAIGRAEMEIENMPSAQPEIIRCKDCKHWAKTCGDNQWSLGNCGLFEKHLVMCKGYCAWAERK